PLVTITSPMSRSRMISATCMMFISSGTWTGSAVMTSRTVCMDHLSWSGPDPYHTERGSNAGFDGLGWKREPTQGFRAGRQRRGVSALQLGLLEDLSRLDQEVCQAPQRLGGGGWVVVGEKGIEAQRGRREAVAVTPHGGGGIVPVLGEQAPPQVGDQVRRFDQVLELLLGDEVVEVDPHPARLDNFTASGDLLLEPGAGGGVDTEKAVPVRTGARAPAPGLDAEQVVEHGHNEVRSEE